MKVSELIERLKAVLNEDGDLEVAHLSYDESYCPVVDVSVMELAIGDAEDADEDLICVLNPLAAYK